MVKRERVVAGEEQGRQVKTRDEKDGGSGRQKICTPPPYNSPDQRCSADTDASIWLRQPPRPLGGTIRRMYWLDGAVERGIMAVLIGRRGWLMFWGKKQSMFSLRYCITVEGSMMAYRV